MEHIQIIKKVGGRLSDSFLAEGMHYISSRRMISVGFILDKKIGTNCPKRIENAKILIANTRKLLASS